ncbi:MAG: YHYH protein, partial [Actinomycetota bacterium]|nr:YHYH protein [Actinomycetota bacterium]
VYPIQQSDDAYRFDRNPNRIASQSVGVSVPAKPKRVRRARCTSGGPVGYLDTGAAIFNALDAGGKDAPAHEVQDRCDGHPQISGVYHYHALPRCLRTGSKKAHSKRIGWAMDGFPIHGPRGEGGEYMRNSVLDACHGHSHTVKVDGRKRRLYHYHATMEFPYTVGCFRGEQAERDSADGGGGGMPEGPPPMP